MREMAIYIPFSLLKCGERESDTFNANYETLIIQIEFENLH